MISDLENVRKVVDLLGDEGFVAALTNAEKLVEDVDETLDRVERIEGEAEETVREAEQTMREVNEALQAVDSRMEKVDETISLLEAKIEAGFSAGFFFFALNSFRGGDLLLASGLLFMGLLGASSLLVTLRKMPQVQRLRQAGRYAVDRFGGQKAD